MPETGPKIPQIYTILRDRATRELVNPAGNPMATLLELGATLEEATNAGTTALWHEKMTLIKETQKAIGNLYGFEADITTQQFRRVFSQSVLDMPEYKLGMAPILDMLTSSIDSIKTLFKPGSSAEIYLGLAQREAETLASRGLENPGMKAARFYEQLIVNEQLNRTVSFVGANVFILMMGVAHEQRLRALSTLN